MTPFAAPGPLSAPQVSSDDEAVKLMNDSPFGLTATIWTADEHAAVAIGDQYGTGRLADVVGPRR